MAFIDELKKVASLREIVEAHTALTPLGNERYRGFSPFKQEKNPSFFVDDNTKLWKDFASNKGGGIVQWFIEKEGMTGREAVHYLADRYDIELDEASDPNDKLRKCLKAAHGFYRRGRQKAIDYVLSRGYPEEMVDKFELGYAPDSYYDIITFLKSQGFEDKVIVECGIGMWDNKNSGKVLARQRHRVTIPVKDLNGGLIGFIGRACTDDIKPKYLNPTVSPIFSKETTLFNFSNIRPMIKEKGRVAVVEGPFDAMMGSLKGEPSTSTLGTSVSDYQLGVLSKVTNDIYIVFDNDSAGQEAMLDIFRRLEESGVDVITYLVTIPEGKDVADYVKARGVEAFTALIEAAIPDNSFVISALYEQAKKTSTKESAITRKVLEQVKPYFKHSSYSYRTLDLLDRLSQLLNLDKSKLDAWMKTETDFKHNSQVYKKIESIEFPGAIYERRIMTECLKDPSKIAVLKTMGITRYDIESHLVSQVLSIVDANKGDPFTALQENLSQEDYDTVLSAYMNAEPMVLDIYELGGIIIANKSKVRGAVSSVTNILGRKKTSTEREMVPTYKELLRRMQNE